MSDFNPYDQFDVPDKDPNYVYRFCNSDERAMRIRKAQGYETVVTEAANAAPTGDATQRRGIDLVLCRIPRKLFEERVDSRRKAMHAQHRGAIDTAIENANELGRQALKDRGATVRSLAFKTSDDPNFN